MNDDIEQLTETAFVRRFTQHYLNVCGFSHFADGQSVAEYCAEVAPSYFADPFQRETGPEECADADMNYLGED